MAEFQLPNYERPEPKFEVTSGPPKPNLKRLPWVWVVLFGLFGMMIASAVYESATSSKGKKALAQNPAIANKMIEMKMALSQMSKRDTKTTPLFEDEIENLLEDAKSKPEAQRMRIVLRVEDKQKPFDKDITNLLASKSESDKAFANLFLATKTDKKSAEVFLNQLDKKDLASKIADVQIREKLGDTTVRGKTFDSTPAIIFSLITMMGFLAWMIGCGVWIYYNSARRNGKLLPRGGPLSSLTLAEADRVALAAVYLFLSYLVSSLLISKQSFWFVPYLAIAITLIVLMKVPILGLQLSAKKMGIEFSRMGEKLAWGIGGLFANVPVLAFELVILSILSRFVAGGSHPASEQLLNSNNPATIAKILVLGCIVAPIWEEFLFRGLLFPAITTLTRSPLIGAILSSLMFAGIHPQGFIGILPLTTIAMMCCGLTYQTKSLVPGMILHAVNNFSIMVITIVMGNYLDGMF